MPAWRAVLLLVQLVHLERGVGDAIAEEVVWVIVTLIMSRHAADDSQDQRREQ
ncbi:MAG TPA: hypothetical protein VJ793_14015 [Anaerolineae bacterium]|nr:hypothetical protein [Anaerolineae bacterium]